MLRSAVESLLGIAGRRSGPWHADLGELSDALGWECRGAGVLVGDPGAELQRYVLLLVALTVAPVHGDRLDVLPRHPQVSFALVVLLGRGVVERPPVAVAATRRRFLVVTGGVDAQDVLAHPLLDAGEFVEAECLRSDPSPQVLALA